MSDTDHGKPSIADSRGSRDTVTKAVAPVDRPAWRTMQLLAALACTSLVACHGAEGTNHIDTTFEGFPTAGSTIDAYTILYTGPDCSDPEQQISVIAVVLSDSAGGCAALQAGRARASTEDLDLTIVGQSLTPGAAPPAFSQVLAAQETNGNGSLDVGLPSSDGAGNYFTFTAAFAQRDARCQTSWTEAISDDIELSAVQIQSLDATEAQGVFQLAFTRSAPVGLYGGFSQAHGCPLTSAQFCALSTGTLTCQ
jgi:hypothetical protein